MTTKKPSEAYDKNLFNLFTQSETLVNDLIEITIPSYQDAFLNGVWQEVLSKEVVEKRLTRDFSVDFHGYWLVDKTNGTLACTSWFEYTSLDFIKNSKSPLLAEFAKEILDSQKIKIIAWYSETFTHSNYWGMGYAKLLTDLNFADIQQKANKEGGVLVLLRMRNDNLKIININEKRGFQRTGITMPCTLKPDTNHEFWFKVIK